MNESHSEPAYRAISIIALIQAGVVVGGTLFVAAMLKAHGYGGGTVPDTFFRSDALFVRHFGFTLLLLPVAWAVAAVITARVATRPWLPPLLLVVGIAVVLCAIWSYVMLGFNPAIL
ncbi:MAG: hypothetical protein QM796_11205 [Chthoniobacteraceae bacterium]